MKDKYYYKDGSVSDCCDYDKELHRVNGPAIEWANGDKFWYINGKLHRVNGPAIEYANGGKYWYVDGKRHRVDGPAVEWADDHKEWWVDGKRHRVDGPAVEYANGAKYWWVDGKSLTKEEFDNYFNKSKEISSIQELILTYINSLNEKELRDILYKDILNKFKIN